MEGKETRECQVYDGKSVAVGFLRKKREWGYLRYVAVALAMMLCATFAVWLFRSDGVSDFLATLATGGSGISGGGYSDAESDRHTDAEQNTERNEPEETVKSPAEIEKQTEEGQIPPVTDELSKDVIEADMSLSEKGDGYIINYSGMAVDAEGLLEMGFGNAKYSYSERPVVLLLHTHTSEGYSDTDRSNPMHLMTRSVVAVGERISQELNRRGISTVHCTVIHDDKGSPYGNARETIEMMLEIYPTIEYVIDLHRAELYDEDGRPIKITSPSGDAQIRVTVSSEGQKMRDSLALALTLRQRLNRNDQRLCLPVVFTSSSYNALLSPYYLKIDVGSIGNNASEALEASKIFAEAFADVLKK